MLKRKLSIFIALTVILCLISIPFVFAADKTVSKADMGYISSETPDASSQTAPFLLSADEIPQTAVFYKFDISSVSVPQGKYIIKAVLKFTLTKNSAYDGGEMVVYGTENNWSGSTLSYSNAPALDNAVGRLGNVNLNSSYNKAARVDVTSYFSENYYSGNSEVSFAVTNVHNVDCTVAATAPALEITYGTSEEALSVGKPEFYNNTIASKNCAYNGDMGGKMFVRIPVTSVSATERKLYISVASYSAEDVLLETSRFEKAVYSATNESIVSVAVNHNAEAGYMKAFVWNEKNAPLAESSWYTKESVAALKSASASSGEMNPGFSEDVYDYYILYDEEPEVLPEISFEYKRGMKISEEKSDSFDKPTTVTVTSPDRNKTVVYSFHHRIKKTAVLEADRLGIKGDKLNAFSLPLTTVENTVSRENDDITLLSFDESLFVSSEIGISGLELDLWAKADNEKIEVLRNKSSDWNEPVIAEEEGSLCEEAVISSASFRNYKIRLNPAGFGSASEVELAIKGNIDIYGGSEGIETAGAIRIPAVNLTWYEKKPYETASVTWEDRYIKNHGTEYPFAPADKYISTDNPPAFSVPYVQGAESYDFVVSSDKEMKNIKYSASGVNVNVHAFPCEFIPGTYYWSARYRTAEGVSEWFEPKRFSVRPDSFSCPVPDTGFVTEKFASMGHPRLIVNESNLEEFRALKSASSDIYNTIISSAEAAVKSPVKNEAKATNTVEQIYDLAFAYILTGDTKYSDAGIDILTHVAGWDINGATSYKTQDQIFRNIVSCCAIGYDWLYNEMTVEQRTLVADMLAARAVIEEHPTEGLNDSPYQIITSPYLSHGWGHMEAVLSVAIALAGDNGTTTAFIKKYLPYKTSFVQYGYQDGAHANGHQYSTYYDEDQKILYSLKGIGINLFNKSSTKNLWKYYFYTSFNNASMEFGDESYGRGADTAVKLLLQRGLFHSLSPYAKWKYDSIAIGPSRVTGSYYTAVPVEVEPKKPYDMPKSYHFKDAGYVAMHSDLFNDSERVSLYFRSSEFGSENHSHPDQNSFHINAYGRRLAIDSGYYDSYQSTFDAGYTKQTYAHNAITYDGGQGQPMDVRCATGKITNFITTDEFDLATGEAAEAYNWLLGKYGYSVSNKVMDRAERHIIYIRPDTYIVMDDLKAKDNDTHSYEWWLNAQYEVNFKESMGAEIKVNDARLDAEVIYPPDIKKAAKIDTFSGPDGVIYTPKSSFVNRPVHQRVYFATPSVNQTKIVTVLSVYKGEEKPISYERTDYNGYIKLKFEDGTICYIRTGDGEYEINADGITFNGDALVKKNGSWMLVDGSLYSENGRIIASSDGKASVAISDNNVCVSSIDDVKVSLESDKVNFIKDSEGNAVGNDEEGYGISWSYEKGRLELSSLSGFHSLFVSTTDSSEIPVTVH